MLKDYAVDYDYSEEEWEIRDFPQLKRITPPEEDDDMIYYKHKKEKELSDIRVK